MVDHIDFKFCVHVWWKPFYVVWTYGGSLLAVSFAAASIETTIRNFSSETDLELGHRWTLSCHFNETLTGDHKQSFYTVIKIVAIYIVIFMLFLLVVGLHAVCRPAYRKYIAVCALRTINWRHIRSPQNLIPSDNVIVLDWRKKYILLGDFNAIYWWFGSGLLFWLPIYIYIYIYIYI